MEHELHMRAALELAKQAAAGGDVPVGCVITDESGAVIGTGCNRREADGSAVAHAEVEAITAACKTRGSWRLEGCTLYVTLEPCPMCAGAMVMSQLSDCVYGAADEKQGCCGSVYDLPGDAALAGTTKWQSGVMAEECGKMMREFFAGRRA